MPNKNQKRMQDKTRRVLQLIEALAAQRWPKSVSEICQLLPWQVCRRTVLRDVELLESMGLVYRADHAPQGVRGPRVPRYKLNLVRAENLRQPAEVRV